MRGRQNFSPRVKKILRAGGVGVIPTDTLYGLVGRADLPRAVRRVYELKRRPPGKPAITLIADVEDLKRWGIKLTAAQAKFIAAHWPGPISIILSGRAFRLPRARRLRELVRAVGPLVAPSANPQDLPPAATIAAAQRYFGTGVDFYVDSGTRRGNPSRLVRLHSDGAVETLR